MSFEVETQETLNDQLQVRREKMSQLREKRNRSSELDSNKKYKLKKSITNLKELLRNLLLTRACNCSNCWTVDDKTWKRESWFCPHQDGKGQIQI